MKRLISGIAILLIIGGVIAYFVLAKHPGPFAKKVNAPVSFIIFYPDNKATGYSIDSSTIHYEAATKVLSYNAVSNTDRLIITEQVTPDQVSEIPQYWSALVTKLQVYKEFDTINGHVALTHPVELKGGQSALFNGEGTFMFIHPTKDLTVDQWRFLLNSLDSEKPGK